MDLRAMMAAKMAEAMAGGDDDDAPPARPDMRAQRLELWARFDAYNKQHEQTQAASAPDRQRQAADRLLARISALKTETELNALEADDAVKVGRARLRSELNVEIEDALAAAFDRLADQAADTGESFPGDDVPPAPVAESAEAAS